MKKVRYGIIGIGKQGSFYASFFKDFPDFLKDSELTAVCDISSQREEWAKENLKGIPFYKDYHDLINSGKVDAVIIDTPHYFHPEIACFAFQKGLHVLSDKPSGVYLLQVKEMNEEAKKHPELLFGMIFNQRTDNLYIKAKELIEQGKLGKLTRAVWIITDWYRPKAYYAQGGWRGTWAGEGGGVLLNQCPHQLDLLTWFMGIPTKVYADLSTVGRKINVENDVTAMMEFPSQAKGVFITSTHDAPGTNRLEITGEKGRIIIEKGQLILTENEEAEPIFSEHNTEFWGKPKNTETIFTEEEIKPPFNKDILQHLRIIANFTEVLLDRKKKLIAPGEEGINGLTLSNAIHLSGWTKKEVRLPLDDQLFLAELKKRIEEEKTSSNK
ncbi:MAG: Gfo/Idh/MocA family oxidoreductase [Bacilli bacterium]|jgi:predicted dehydrogenase|nr:Gfo/Idh/MocA family oxidoreductase [Bacilli bacterium]